MSFSAHADSTGIFEMLRFFATPPPPIPPPPPPPLLLSKPHAFLIFPSPSTLQHLPLSPSAFLLSLSAFPLSPSASVISTRLLRTSAPLPSRRPLFVVVVPDFLHVAICAFPQHCAGDSHLAFSCLCPVTSHSSMSIPTPLSAALCRRALLCLCTAPRTRWRF